MKDTSMGIIVLLCILAIVLFGGTKNTNYTTNNSTTEKDSVEEQKQDIADKIEELKLQVSTEEKRLTQSQYYDIVTFSYINRSTDPDQEYVTIKVSSNAKGTIPVTGWKLKSTSSGNEVSIPKATYLFFTGMENSEENIYLEAGDTLYLVTGISPNGASFKVNKCSGYLEQFQDFVPYLNASCPLPKNEDLSSIPNSPVNDDCLEYIESFGQCKIQTSSLPANWTPECSNFIYDKINYPYCINTHKNDEDFYQNEWRVYLKRSENIWKTKREEIVLYDNLGKIVDTIEY